jgi:hypothetical protein
MSLSEHAPCPRASHAQFRWDDPVLLEQQLTKEERLIRDTAQQRRQILRTAGIAAIAGMAGSTLAGRSPILAQNADDPRGAAMRGERNSAPLGARIQGVQHFGVTVQNMDRAYEFHTEVLGGTEVMRDGDFQGERIHMARLRYLHQNREFDKHRVPRRVFAVGLGP